MKETESKECKRRLKEERPTRLPTQESHKKIKLEATIYKQWIWCRLMQALCQFICALVMLV